jgi:hypothetical protein
MTTFCLGVYIYSYLVHEPITYKETASTNSSIALYCTYKRLIVHMFLTFRECHKFRDRPCPRTCTSLKSHPVCQGLYSFFFTFNHTEITLYCTKVHYEHYTSSKQLFPVSPNYYTHTFFSALFNSFDVLFTLYKLHICIRIPIRRGMILKEAQAFSFRLTDFKPSYLPQ